MNNSTVQTVYMLRNKHTGEYYVKANASNPAIWTSKNGVAGAKGRQDGRKKWRVKQYGDNQDFKEENTESDWEIVGFKLVEFKLTEKLN